MKASWTEPVDEGGQPLETPWLPGEDDGEEHAGAGERTTMSPMTKSSLVHRWLLRAGAVIRQVWRLVTRPTVGAVRAPGPPEGQLVPMATIAAGGGSAPVEPLKSAPPKVNTPPSEAARV